jgi:hypothetical protein
MTILLRDLEDNIEKLSEGRMQQISGGISLTGVVSSVEARNRRSRTLVQDVGVGAAPGVLPATDIRNRGIGDIWQSAVDTFKSVLLG